MILKLKAMFSWVLDAVYPSKCISCGEIIDKEDDLCPVCLSSVEFINPNKLCRICGNEKEYCICKSRVFHFERLVSVFEYSSVARAALLSYKINRNEQYSRFFIRQMSLAILREYRDISFNAVCSVPASCRSRMKRGFDHTAALRDGIALKLKLPVLKDVLKCRPFHKAQHGSTAQSRIKNVEDKYYCSKSLPGGNYLLIDDVKTTGATLDQCARQLLIAGADRVYAVTALATVYKYNKKDNLKSKQK